MSTADASTPHAGPSSAPSGPEHDATAAAHPAHTPHTSGRTPSPAQVSPVSWIYLAICAVLVSLNLRTLYSSLSAILPEVMAATGLSGAGVTVLTTVPVTLLGVFAPLAPVLARRIGAWQVLFVAMLLLTVGMLIRALPPFGSAPLATLLTGTVISGLAIALSNVVLPSIVKQDFRNHIGLMSGLYTTCVAGSAAFGAALTFPALESSGSWNIALGLWALPALAVAGLLIPVILRHRSRAHLATSTSGRSPMTSAIAWQITVMMVFQSMMSFPIFAWLAPILRERGMDGTAAGLVIALNVLLQMSGSLVAPILAARIRSQSLLNASMALLTGIGWVLCIIGPLQGVWVWAALLGLGQGSLTALALTMISLRSHSTHMALRVSGMMQGLGYGLGSAGTLLVGQILTATGDVTPVATLFAATSLACAVFGWLAGRPRLIQE